MATTYEIRSSAPSDSVICATISEKMDVDEVDRQFNITDQIKLILNSWTDKYKKRFSSWFLRRVQRYNIKIVDFEQSIIYDPFECYKHLINWDRSFKKALMKDKLIDKQRLKIRDEFKTKRRLIDPSTQDVYYVPIVILDKYIKKGVPDNQDYKRIEQMEIVEEGMDIMVEQGYTLLVPTDSVDKRYNVTIPVEDEPFIQFPFNETDYNQVVQPYLDLSPFFRRLFSKCRNIRESINQYMQNVQFRRGTPSYFRDWLFGSRRRRDDLMTFLDGGVEQGDTGVTSNDLEQTNVLSSTSNITFVDERPVDITSLHTKGEVYSRDQNNDISENDWTLKKVLEREYPISGFEWKVGLETGKEVFSGGLPKLITDDVNCMITRQLKFFSFLRAGVHVRVQLNGTKFHCGRLLVFFKPITWDDDKEENFYSLTCFPSFFLDASVSNSGEVYIPFTHLLSYFSQESKTLFNDSVNTLGLLKIIVFNKLAASDTASQSLFGQVYISLVDPYVHLPTYEIKAFSYGEGYMQGLESVLKKGAGNLIDMGVGLDKKFTGGLVTGAGNALCNLLGVCDKPTDPVSASPIVNRTSAPLCHGAGLDRSTRLGLSPVSLTNSPPSMLGAVDSDYNILTLCQLPCLVGTVTWTASNAIGHQNFYMGVTPTWLGTDQKTSDSDNSLSEYRPTMLAYISRAFCRWRGDLKIKIQVVATQFHSGRLALVYDPHGCANNNLGSLDENKSHNIIVMDIQEQQELVIDLPYFAVKPWLRCDRFRAPENLKVNDTKDLYASFLDCDIMGIFRIFVLNQLVHPSNVPNQVDINVFFYAGDNFELTIPNPVAPLSVRAKVTNKAEPNNPWYPWCQAAKFENNLCSTEQNIYNIYNIGFDLNARGHIKPTAEKKWYQPTLVIENSETICFMNQILLVQKFVAGTDEVCKKLIDSLPDYPTAAEMRGTIKKIDGTTVNTYDKLQDPVITSLEHLTQRVDANYSNILNEIIPPLRDIREESSRTQSAVFNIERRNPLLENQEYHQIQVDGDVPEGNVRWERHSAFELLKEQGLESYTTTRDQEGGSVTITDGNKSSNAVVNTVSENAMQIQTLLRRYYPLWVSSNISYSNDFTIISIPVTPSFVPEENKTGLLSDVERHYEVHNLAWFMRIFTYWRGSLRYKIIYNADDSDIYVWHNPIDAKAFSVVPGFRYNHLTNQMNFASDVGISRVQQSLEIEVPYYSGFNQLLHSHISSKADLRAQNGTLFIAVRNRNKDFNISIYISTGDDFTANILRAPPVLHEIMAKPYTILEEGTSAIDFPEIYSSLHHDSRNMQIPGQAAFNAYTNGIFKVCTPDEETSAYRKDEREREDFLLNELNHNNQQNYMYEQMFSLSGCIDNAISNSESVKNMGSIYNEEIKPCLNEVKDVASEVKDYLNEFKYQILPQILGTGKDAHKNIVHTRQLVEDFIPKIQDAIDHLNAMCISNTNASINVSSAANNVADWASYSKCFMQILLLTSLWVNLLDLINSFSWTRLINVICITCVIFKVQCCQVIQWVYLQATKLYEDYRSKANNGAMAEQGLEEFVSTYQDNLVFVLASVATVIYCAIFGCTPSWAYIKKVIQETITAEKPKTQGLSDVLKNIHFSSMGFKAIGNAFEFFQKWITKLLNYLLGSECTEVLLEKEFKEKAAEIEKWIDEVASFEEEDLLMRSLVDIDLHNKLYYLRDQGVKFTTWTLNNGVSKNVSSIIRDTNRRLTLMLKEVGKKRPMHGFRYAPFVIMLYGDSSIGKSNMMHHFTDMLREEMCIPYYNSVYCVPTAKKYLDGYSGQSIIEWDDALQCVEADEMIGNFINWRSNADTIVNMADCPEKGMPFTSKAIIMSTNNAEVNINSLRDNNAFKNRINVYFKCKMHDNWTIKEVKQLKEKDKTFPFVKLSVYDYTTKELIQGNLSFVQAIEYARKEFKNWDIKQNNLLNDYFSTHDSLRIPPGVQVVKEKDVITSILNEEGLTEEQILDAKIFQQMFVETIDEVEKESLANRVYKIFDTLTGKIEFVQYENKKKKISQFYELIKMKLKMQLDKFKTTCKEFYIAHPNFNNVIMITSILGLAALVIKQIYSMFLPLSVEEGNKQTIINEGGCYDYNVRARVKVVKPEAIAEGTDDPEAVDMGRNKVYRAMRFLGWETGKNTVSLQCLAIGGKVILCPHHFFRKAVDGDVFYMIDNGVKIPITYNSVNMFRIKDKDAVLYYMGARFDSHKHLVKCFVEEKYFSKISSSTSASLFGKTLNGVLMEKSCIAKGNVTMSYYGEDDDKPTYVQYGWRYEIDTVSGECGSLLLACNKALPPPGKIIGMHTAGYSHKRGGFAILLTREMIETTLQIMKLQLGQDVYNAPLPIQVNPDEELFNEQCKVIPEGYFSYYGVMDSKFCPSQPTKTQFKKTPFHGELYPVTKAPALLQSKNGISPLRNALGKFGKITFPYKAKHIKAVRASILNDLMCLESDLGYKPLSDEIAIFGVDGVAYCDKMNMHSSPGWPYQCLYASKGEIGKSYLFDEDKRCIKDELLQQNLLNRENMAKIGYRVPSIWRDCLKDELRSLEKVKEGKTRLFNIPPVDFSILVRKYFLAFEQAFYKGHGKFFSAVGINPESFEWTVSYNRLRTYGYKCVAGDFKTFDGMAMADLLWEIGEMISDWYGLKGGEDVLSRNVRRVLMDEMIHTFQLVLNCVYKSHQGNPSGNPITAPLNTILNIFYMRLSWMEIMEVQDYRLYSMDAYSKHVIEEAYGDDNRLVIKQEVIKLFNQVTIAEALKRHGITYTDESKSDEMVPYRHLLQTSFLKRKYRFDKELGSEIVLPIMDVDTITSLTNWYRDAPNIEEQLQENQRAALTFAFFHGREFFNDFNKGFIEKMRENNMMPVCITYDEMLDSFEALIHDDGGDFGTIFTDFGFK